MRTVRISIIAASLGLGAMTLFMPSISQAASAQQHCEQLEEKAAKAGQEAAKEVYEAEEFEQVKEDRISAFQCQQQLSGSVSSWVKGEVSMGFLEPLFDLASDELTQEACDAYEAKVREVQAELSELDDMLKDLPTTREEAEQWAREQAEEAAREHADKLRKEAEEKVRDELRRRGLDGRYTDLIGSQIDSRANAAIEAGAGHIHLPTPGYTPQAVQPATRGQDPWSAIRDSLGRN